MRSQPEDWPLPWQIEVALWFIGLVCMPLGMWSFTSEITSPATMLGEMLGIPVDTQKFVEPFRPMIWIFGLLIGWQARCWLRRMVVRRLNRLV